MTVNLSAGVCLFPRDQGNNPDVLLRLADQALYESKSNKQNRTHFWTIFGEGVPPKDRAT